MFRHIEIQNLNDYFRQLNERETPGVYFYRINGYSDAIGRFIRQYYETARRNGVIIEGRLQNPDEKNLSYYNEMMGMYFEMDTGFIASGLKKWLPRMNDHQRENVALSLYDALFLLQKSGKTEYMLKNAYIKYSKREQRYHSHQLPLGDLSDDESDLVEKRSFVLEDYCGLFLQDLSNLLSNREFYVIIQYIFHQKSINDISKELCISRQATNKIKKKAFEKLRSELD